MDPITKCGVCCFRFKNSMGRWVEVKDLAILFHLHIIAEEKFEECPICASKPGEKIPSILTFAENPQAFLKGGLN